MKLLVTTPSWLFLVDSDTHELKVVEDNSPEYYGVSWTHDGKLALSHSGIDHMFVRTLEEYATSEVGSLSVGEASVPNALSAPHQLLCVGDRIVATNTGRNCLTVFRTDDFFYRHHWLDDIRWDRGLPVIGSHFNSVFHKGDRLYLLAHNHDPNQSCLLELDWPSLQVLRRIESDTLWSHNIWIAGDRMIVCNSKNSSLVDVFTAETLWQSGDFHSMTRGLACANDSVFVGKSSISIRKHRRLSDGGIWVLDRNNWKEIDFIEMPFSGVVHEIRVIDAVDECHHGIPYNGVITTDSEATERYQALGYQQHEIDLVISRRGWSEQLGCIMPFGEKGISVDEPLGIALYSSVSARDIAIEGELEVSQASPQSHIGLICRYRGPGDSNMFVGLIYQDEGKYSAQIWKNVDGQWTNLAVWHLDKRPLCMRLEAFDDEITMYCDGVSVLTVRESDVNEPGRIGIRGTRGGVNAFAFEVGGDLCQLT